MLQLLYRSRAAQEISPGAVFKIIETSARKNPAREITGFLVHSRDHFLQLVEGPQASIEALLDTLRQDDRHCDLEVLVTEPIDKRCFPNWRMQRINAAPASQAALVKDFAERGVSRRMRDAVDAFFGEGRAAA